MLVQVTLLNGCIVPGILILAVSAVSDWDTSMFRGFVAVGECVFNCALWQDDNSWYVQY